METVYHDIVKNASESTNSGLSHCLIVAIGTLLPERPVQIPTVFAADTRGRVSLQWIYDKQEFSREYILKKAGICVNILYCISM